MSNNTLKYLVQRSLIFLTVLALKSFRGLFSFCDLFCCPLVLLCDLVSVCLCCQMRDRERRAVYHEPDGVRHLSENLRGIGGHRRHPTTPQNRVEPGLIHWVDSHTHIICQILPGERKIQVNTGKKALSNSLFSSYISCNSTYSVFTFHGDLCDQPCFYFWGDFQCFLCFVDALLTGLKLNRLKVLASMFML